MRRQPRGRVLSTVLFTDVVGSTDIAAHLEDRRWREVLRRHHEITRSALRKHGGREVDTAGDGFFATFPEPARAVRCACAIVDGVRELGIEVRAGLSTAPSTRSPSAEERSGFWTRSRRPCGASILGAGACPLRSG